MLENDQNYYAWVPKEASIPNMYEVKIESVDVEKFYNEQIEMVLLYVILECILLVN